jgi:hypothetical protein
VLLACVARTAAAQSAPSPPAAAEDPQANPGRPTISTPATLTPVGYLQLENGVLAGYTSGDFKSLYDFNQVTKLAVHPRIQIIAQFEPVAWSHAADTSATKGYVGGIAAGAQVLLRSGQGARPSIAVSYSRTAFSGSAPDLDIGSARQSLLALVSCDLGAFHVDTNAIFNDQLDSTRHVQYGQTLSISHPLGATTIVGELWHFTQPTLGGDAMGLLWAVSYAPNRHLVYDAGFDAGVTGTSTHWEIFGGFTYLIPHRLWRSR